MSAGKRDFGATDAYLGCDLVEEGAILVNVLPLLRHVAFLRNARDAVLLPR
jgi:hypothetical protein